MYQKDQVVLIPARILNVGDVAGTDQQFLDIKFANGAQISGFDSTHVYMDAIDKDYIPKELQGEKSGDISEEKKVEKPIQQDDPSKNPDDKKNEVPNDGQP